MLTTIMVDQEFNSQLGQTKDYEIGICCFSTMAKHTSLRSKSNDWLALNNSHSLVQLLIVSSSFFYIAVKKTNPYCT